MIKRLAYFLANYYADKGLYPIKELNIYAYGFELILSTVLNALGLLIISLIMGNAIDAVLFSLAFIPLRSTAGGYHTKHHWTCFLSINIVFILFEVIFKFMISYLALPYIVFATILSALFIWSFSPIRAANNPLREDQKSKFRKRSITISIINIIITITFILASQLPIMLLIYYQSGALAASISLAIAKIIVKYKIHE